MILRPMALVCTSLILTRSVVCLWRLMTADQAGFLNLGLKLYT